MTTYQIKPSSLHAVRGGALRTHAAGFTLIELMIVVLIIGILAAIAMASYEWAVTKSRRATAASCLQENAQRVERFRTTTMSYAGAPAPAACTADLNGFYTFGWQGGNPTATTFAIAATPVGRQLAKDTACGTLTINQVGARGSAGSEAECW